MICVTIACGSHTRMINEHHALAEDGVQLVELRLDFLRREPELHRLIPDRPTAIVVTARRKEDGGIWRESEENRQKMLRAAIAMGPEFVDLELDVADKIPPYGKTRRIISFHDMQGTPDDLEALHAEMLTKSPYFIKIAVTPKSVEDIVRFVRFIRVKNQLARQEGEKGVRVVGMCMGEMGQATRILAKKFGMPFTYATFSPERIIAPGMLVYKDLLDVYHYEQTDHDTAVYGIIGNPIGHSLSPLIHNKSFVQQNINAVYVPFPLDEADVPSFMKLAPELDVKGISVTIPHKVTVMSHLTKMDPAVERIGACNTVLFRGKERLGYNTDYMAAASSIELAMGGNLKDEKSVLDTKSVLVLGAGGAGMALAYGLKRRGALVTVTDINGNRAYDLAKHLDVEVADWRARNDLKTEILVNCTPIGMFPNVDESPIDKGSLRSGMVVFDAVYNPENTLLVKTAKMKACTVVTGVEMFVGQACLQFKLFTGEKASGKFMQGLVRDAISAAR